MRAAQLDRNGSALVLRDMAADVVFAAAMIPRPCQCALNAPPDDPERDNAKDIRRLLQEPA
ncbi:hypothetical protein LN533_19245 [Xanthomonas vesicatoria]|uniref:Uncharacterized protein n=1 Tax=Xanthomonas vesicatoria TaxID=56460 RepID=A0AAJ0N259_9XANT|nr:hypothetical protein [Xanthomonas vesicatoria]APO96629.1 hypothetical protein BI313_20415 [Xanthomonas vesicatoria]KHM90392.1 hypothetical protein OR61_22095 [Xanthomonas vesicatoria]KHM96986.1 hypothetical protein OR60_04305 [Xanthomonas vesicatoria]MCC8624983.1 hypothetical protein [Xanthomonas vesicatoria]MCC8704319.1 hypothetical protein [Xanthomonas vesicatoria]